MEVGGQRHASATFPPGMRSVQTVEEVAGSQSLFLDVQNSVMHTTICSINIRTFLAFALSIVSKIKLLGYEIICVQSYKLTCTLYCSICYQNNQNADKITTLSSNVCLHSDSLYRHFQI